MCRRNIVGFVLPLGATTNMNGASRFEAVVVLSLAQVFGVELSLGTQAVIVVLAVLTSVGAAGVPSGSIPLLVGVLETVGIPGEGIAIVIGVDRLLDMGRTAENVTGVWCTSSFLRALQPGQQHCQPSRSSTSWRTSLYSGLLANTFSGSCSISQRLSCSMRDVSMGSVHGNTGAST